jgi:hypothetical protein
MLVKLELKLSLTLQQNWDLNLMFESKFACLFIYGLQVKRCSKVRISGLEPR